MPAPKPGALTSILEFGGKKWTIEPIPQVSSHDDEWGWTQKTQIN